MATSSRKASRYDVIVIGAGHNGLTTAALLAKRGRKVLVVERRNIIGGIAAGEEFHPGYRSAGLLHDTTGIRPGVVDDLQLDRLGLALTSEPPAVFAPQRQGRGLLLHHDPSRAAEEIRAVSPRDSDRYGEYRAFFSRIKRLTRRLFNEQPVDLTGAGASSLFHLMTSGLALRRLGKKDMLELLRIVPMCVADWLNEWFETQLLKCLLAAPAIEGTFMGPWSPGSNANLIRWEALAGRAAQGGGQALIDALEAAAGNHGVEIRTEAEVQRIRVSGDQVDGVTLADGSFIAAAVVAASCDPRQTFLQLIAGDCLNPKLEHRITNFRMKGTTALVNLALSEPLRFACRPDLAIEYARTGETLDHLERAFDPVKYGRFANAPILDIHVPTVANPRMAPEGHSVASILAHFVPYALNGGWNDDERDKLGDTIVNVLQQFAPGLERSIVAREVLTPADIQQRYGITDGHIHHGEHALDQLLVRPCPECGRYETPIEGLYLCGSGSHPGGGLTCAPGALAASTILNRRASAKPQQAFG